MKQRTLKKAFSLEGEGLHTGARVLIKVHPAPVNTGFCFQRIDLENASRWQVCPDQIQMQNTSGRCTAIGEGAASVQTIEHVMAALFGLEIDNAVIEINGPEVPGMDGSALPFVKAIMAAGIAEQDAPKRYLTLKSPIAIAKGEASIAIFPSEEFKITYILDYTQAGMAPQVFNFVFGKDLFFQDIAPARTFCLRHEAEALKRSGLGKGAGTHNTLVMDNGAPVDNVLRFPDECARHKVADLIGDLSFLGKPIRGHVFAVRSGHHLNACLVKAIYEQNEKKQFQSVASSEKGGAAVDINGIMESLPHRYPFLLVDRILEIDSGKRAVGIKNLTMNEHFFQGHFPGRPIMPGVLMIEAMAQVGGVLLKRSYEDKNYIGLFMSVDNVKFRRTASPGDQLVMEVEVLRGRSRMVSVHGTGRVDGKIVVEADMMFSFVDKEKLFG